MEITQMTQDKLSDERGHILISLAVLMFALIGVWYVVRGIQEHRLQENLAIVVQDYHAGIRKIAKKPEDQAKVDAAFAEIENVMRKYQTNTTQVGR